jgi:hypothetical protein
MSLPEFSTQGSLFSTAGLSTQLFAQTDRYRLIGQRIYPKLASARPTLEKCYSEGQGRRAIEPVLLLGVSILQELDGVPDRQAVEMLRYHAGWNFALNRQLGDEVFHPTSLVNFRHRLLEHGQSALGFQTVLDALVEAGLVCRQGRQRLDSTQIFGRVAKMNRLDCVRETLRLTLRELEDHTPAEQRPDWWARMWERYVESQVDYRASAETLGRKLSESGTDAWEVLQWLRQPESKARAAGRQAQLLRRVFGEQFEVRPGQGVPVAREKEPVQVADSTPTPDSPGPEPVATEAAAESAPSNSPELSTTHTPGASDPSGSDTQSNPASEPAASNPPPAASVPEPMATTVEPKGKGQFDSNRVQNPHDPDATYAVKGQGQQKKEHVGFKVQVAESVSEAVLAPGEPTRNFVVGILAHAAHESDELGAAKMEQEQGQMGLEKPPVQYVDGAYISAQKLAQAQAEGRELIGPAQPAPHKDGRFSTEDFQVDVQARTAVCPAGKTNTQCSRLEEETTGKVNYRFEFSTHCHDCPLRGQCLGKEQRHRTLLVGEHHTHLQARRQEQQTPAFQQRMKHRNAIEGTQSELVRGHGLRRTRFRGLAKVSLQSYFIGAACNVKRWIRREAWQLKQALLTAA